MHNISKAMLQSSAVGRSMNIGKPLIDTMSHDVTSHKMWKSECFCDFLWFCVFWCRFGVRGKKWKNHFYKYTSAYIHGNCTFEFRHFRGRLWQESVVCVNWKLGFDKTTLFEPSILLMKWCFYRFSKVVKPAKTVSQPQLKLLYKLGVHSCVHECTCDGFWPKNV